MQKTQNLVRKNPAKLLYNKDRYINATITHNHIINRTMAKQFKRKVGRPKGTGKKPAKPIYTKPTVSALYIPPEAKGLSEKRRRLCEEYIVDLNATAAAKRAGYSTPTTKQAANILKSPGCRKYVHYLKVQRAKNTQVSQERIIEELARIAYHDKRTFYTQDNMAVPLHELTHDQQTAIKDIIFENHYIPNPDYDPEAEKENPDIPKTIPKRRIKQYKTHNRVNALKMLGHHLGMSLDKPAEKLPENVPQEEVTFESLMRKLPVKELEKFMDILLKVQAADKTPIFSIGDDSAPAPTLQ